MSRPAAEAGTTIGQIDFGDNLDVLRQLPSASADLISIDPPFSADTTAIAADEPGRRFVLVDDNPQALHAMAQRRAGLAGIERLGHETQPPQQGGAIAPASCGRQISHLSSAAS